VLEFDHIGDKRSNVSWLVAQAWSVKRIADEIEACEVVCVNCHRLRTYRRRSSWRTDPSTLDATPDLLANERRNMIHVRSVWRPVSVWTAGSATCEFSSSTTSAENAEM
jgi:hypothetical protein